MSAVNPNTSSVRYGATLEDLKQQQQSLNMRLLFSLENHNAEVQSALETQIKELKKQIDNMTSGGRRT
jgi:hypothetical protein